MLKDEKQKKHNRIPQMTKNFLTNENFLFNALGI